MLRSLRTGLGIGVRAAWIVILAGILTQSTVPLQDQTERVRRYTRQQEFDFLSWTVDALAGKVQQSGLGSTAYLSDAQRRNTVLEFFDLVGQADSLRANLSETYSDPTVADPAARGAPIAARLAGVRARLTSLQPTVEAILQEQVSVVLASLGLGIGGEIFPPVSFHFTPLPLALIISPRTAIREDADIQLDPTMTLAQQVALEQQVERRQDVSALVVPVGGIGVYPTMVEESSALDWVVETVVHEWVHNYLTLRPLGLNYETTPELRTMNETTASLLGNAIGRLVLERYYPALVPPSETAPASANGSPPTRPAFDFSAEMHTTRVTVDRLLAEGKVTQAETYMDARRQVFWDHGYAIRRLNQAYFAFYGAYADQPGGAAGEDPVGAAVRTLWARLGSPTRFLRTMAWMSSYADLQATLARTG